MVNKRYQNSVLLELSVILRTTELIHKENPMHTVLNKNSILPHLSTDKRDFSTKSCPIDVVNAILYKLKSGCQWPLLPVKALFSGKILSYGAAYTIITAKDVRPVNGKLCG